MNTKSAKVYVLMTKWKDEDAEVAGVFANESLAIESFAGAMTVGMPPEEAKSTAAKIALQMVGKLDPGEMDDPDDSSVFGNTRAWILDYEVEGL